MIFISIYAVLISRQKSPQVSHISISLLGQSSLDIHLKQPLQVLLRVDLKKLWEFDSLSKHIVDITNMIWAISASIDLYDPCKDSIFDKRRQVFGTVTQKIADSRNGVE